jgi:hypothetical protein
MVGNKNKVWRVQSEQFFHQWELSIGLEHRCKFEEKWRRRPGGQEGSKMRYLMRRWDKVTCDLKAKKVEAIHI